MGEVRLNRELYFVEIKEGQKIYYGGDQAWFGFTVGECGGCGTVAAANLIAYMDGRSMSKDEFVELMHTMYRYVRPHKIPFVSKNKKMWHGFGWTVGVWPSIHLIWGMQRYGKDHGLPLKSMRISCKKPREEQVAFIKRGLEKDCPIAMLIGRNHYLDMVSVVRPDGSGWIQTHMSHHWVTITQMIQESDEKVMLKASTWGGWAFLDLDLWLADSRWPQAMVYFE